MKRTLIVLAMATIFFACKNKGNNNLATDKNILLTDTALLRRSGLLSDTGHLNPVPGNNVTTTSSTTTTVTTTTSTRDQVKGTRPKSGTGTNAGSSTVSPVTATSQGNSDNTATTPVPVKDRALSDAAIGTAIGAGSGAVIGAVVSKDKVKGAVIGGVVGGAGGYAVGRARDVKSGRVERKKSQ